MPLKRRRARRTFGAGVAAGALSVALAACDAPPPSARCDGLARLPGSDARVFTLEGDTPHALPLRCNHVSCLRAMPDAVVVLQADGRRWATWQADDGVVQPGHLLEAAGPSPMSRQEAWVRSQSGGVSGDAAGFAAPSLPAELRTCGTTAAGGGFGYHVIKNDGSVWQRIEWVKPPADPALRALPQDAYPIADNNGRLCAYGIQRAPRMWDIHIIASGKVVAGEPDVEHAPASCARGDTVLVQSERGPLRIHADGREEIGDARVRRAGSPGPVAEVVSGPLRLPRDDDGELVLELADDRDLAGAPLPRGSVRTGVAQASDRKARALVVERVRLPDCRTREALHLVDLARGAVRTLREGDVVLTRLTYAVDRFFWVEAPPQRIELTGL